MTVSVNCTFLTLQNSHQYSSIVTFHDCKTTAFTVILHYSPIFREIKHFLETGEELPPLGVKERVELAKRHFRLSLDVKGPVTGVFEMRRHLSCYFKGLPDFKQTRIRLVTSLDPDEIFAILDGIADRWGEVPLTETANVYGV